MRRIDEHTRGWLAALGLVIGCSSGATTTAGVPAVAVGPSVPVPAETDAEGGDTDADSDTDGDPSSDDGPGLPEGDCNPGATATCYGGPPGTAGTGICHAGVATCGPDGRWDDCDGWMAPMPEACNGVDDDCNGEPDDPDETCDTGMPGPCGTGAAGCDEGVMTCIPFVQPAAAETCNDGVDNDCNGSVDDGCGTGGGDNDGSCDPKNPGPVCGPAQHCFANPSGEPTCAGPTGFGTQYDTCVTDADCVPDHICVDVGTNSYCMKWCTTALDCPLSADDCRSLDPPSYVGPQEYGVCWDGLP